MTQHSMAVVDTDGVRYALGDCLGQGGQGAVYRVKGKPLAVKCIRPAIPIQPAETALPVE